MYQVIIFVRSNICAIIYEIFAILHLQCTSYTGHKKLRISVAVNADEGAHFTYRFRDHYALDWINAGDRRLGESYLDVGDTDWNIFSFDIDTNGPT